MMDNYRIRRFRTDDFSAFHTSMSEYDVVKMTGAWPWPPDPGFTRNRMATPHAKDGRLSAIDFEGKYIGQVSVVDGVLGYMLAKPHWGRGVASWAVGEKLKAAFADEGLREVTACVWHGNPASEAVLYKHGFVKTGVCEEFCVPRGVTLKNNIFNLSRAEWARGQRLCLKTQRLHIEPFTGDEAASLSALMNDPEIARMMATIPHPFSEADAKIWLSERVFSHEIGADKGFVAKVSLHNGTLVGFVGIGDAPVDTAYAFGRAHWGQGYATEAMGAFLAHCTRTFALKEITAGAMFDNPASAAVLKKLGFARIGEKQHKASVRVEKARLFLYRKINH